VHIPCLLAVLLSIAGLRAQQPRPPVESRVTIIEADGKKAQVIYKASRLLEAPNWSPDGKYLLLNAEGKLWKLPVAGGELELVNTGAVERIDNDHGISPDGRQFVISAGSIYVLPATGGTPRRVTELTPSYYHGWSPDGRKLAYCARREGNFDLYAISTEGGEEQRLTEHAGYDDGPDYSPDGQWIYFNSDRSGSWDIWRIPASGAGRDDQLAERITRDEYEDWFPHPSPDGKWMVFLSFPKGTKGHPPNLDVLLRRMPLKGGRIEVIHKLFGGQGTINVNSWSPDSKRFAFVSYRLLP